MPSPAYNAVPSFIHLEHNQPLPPARVPTIAQQNGTLGSQHVATISSSDTKPLQPQQLHHTTAIFKHFSISRSKHRHPSSRSRNNYCMSWRRPATSRVRGKHGLMKSTNSHSAYLSYHTATHDPLSEHYSAGFEPFNTEARRAHLKKYMQSRRMRLRQRQQLQLQQPLPMDASDMSLDEADTLDEDIDYDDDNNDRNNVFKLDQQQYRQYMWELEQRLWERTESAARSRTHFLMERRLSAGERVDHVQRVVHRQRTQQELRQHRARDELEQKMVRAMARRNAYLEAAIENDPSRRFRRKSSTIANVSTSATVSSGTAIVSRAATGRAARVLTSSSSTVKKDTAMRTKTAIARDSDNSNNNNSNNNNSGQGHEGHGQQRQHGLAKNSLVNMTHTNKKHLTSMTPKCTTISPSTAANGNSTAILEDSNSGNASRHEKPETDHRSSDMDTDIDPSIVRSEAGLERMTIWAQRKIRQRLVQKAASEYMKAIGGSHERVLAMGFNELARLLHTNKNLIQATLRLLKYSSQLVQVDTLANEQRPRRVFKNSARVFLSMYMILAHPSQIRSPEEPAAAADRPTGLSADPAFESLVESSKALLEALQTWLSANLHPNKSSHQDEPSSSPNPTQGIPKDQHQQRHAELLRDFDRAWTSYYNFFEAWKDKDAKRLLQTLLDHAQQIESLWRTVQGDSSARLEWEPRIEEQRRDLRAKAGQLAGPEGAARLDAVFANFVNTTAPDTASNALSSNNNPDSIESISAAPPSTTSSTGANHVVKKRQRVVSVSSSDSEIASTEHVSTSNDIQTLPEPAPAESTSMANKNKSAADQKPKAKKPAVSKPAATGSNAAAKEETSSGSQDILSAVPVGLKKPSKWTNLQLIHELALDTEFKIEPRRPLDAPGSSSSSGQGKDKNTADAPQVSQSLEAQVRAMATKAYFDKIREDAQQGNLGKWIPSLLTTIREQLLDMIPAESAMAVQVSESFDLEFVQQQVDRKVYDIKGALESVLTLMSRLCAPVRDPKVRQIQQDLSQTVIQNPFEQSSVDTSTAASAYSAASASLRDLVSVLQDILELLEVMMLDMANFRLTVARPRLEKQAIPYEQEAFRKSLDKDEVSLDSTRAWLQDTVVNHPQPASTSLVSTSSTFLSPSPSSSSTPSAISSVEGGEHGEGASSAQSHRTNNRYYEVLVQGMLDLIFSKRHFDREDRDYLPATLALDRERLMRYQNEVQGLALVAVMLNVSLNVAPTLKDQEQHELKETLLKLIENPSTSQEQLTEAIIEAKEKALLLAARGRSISPSASASASASHFSTTATTSAAQLLLSEDQKKYIRHTLVRAISFESTLYTVLSQRVRQTIGYFMLTTIPISTTNAAGERRAGAMLDRADLNKMGLGSLASELEALAVQIRFLTKYNAQVYKQWYDPMLTTILSSSVASSAATTISTSINATTETTTGSQQP